MIEQPLSRDPYARPDLGEEVNALLAAARLVCYQRATIPGRIEEEAIESLAEAIVALVPGWGSDGEYEWLYGPMIEQPLSAVERVYQWEAGTGVLSLTVSPDRSQAVMYRFGDEAADTIEVTRSITARLLWSHRHVPTFACWRAE